MKFVSTFMNGRRAIGIVEDELVYDVTRLLPVRADLLQVIASWADVHKRLSSGFRACPSMPLNTQLLSAPIPVPRRNIFCVGKNYREHVVEFSRSGYDRLDRSTDIPAVPVIFSKATTAVVGPFDDIDAHSEITSALDYEAELGVVIGRGGRGIERRHAFDHVWGYVAINDVTARDLQQMHQQWFIGKSLDTHCPMGPFAVTADEIDNIDELLVECRVNGELRQSAHVKDLIFDIPQIISTISAGTTLLSGDVIATGTPAGVGIGYDPPRFLTQGDVVETSVTHLGRQRCLVV